MRNQWWVQRAKAQLAVPRGVEADPAPHEADAAGARAGPQSKRGFDGAQHLRGDEPLGLAGFGKASRYEGV